MIASLNLEKLMTPFAFSAPDAFAQLNDLEHAQLDALEFGVVRMNPDGIVLAYNQGESQITGVEPNQAIGKHFFTQVAPCTDNFMVSARYQEDSLDEEINYIFTKVTTPTRVRLRMLRDASRPYQYLLVKTL